MDTLSPESLVVHTGKHTARPDYTPICTPIHNAVTYTYDDVHTLDEVFAGTRHGYVYHRHGNPTVAALEEAVAALEETDAVVASASGMAAIHLALLAAGVTTGSTILAADDLYGGTHALLTRVFRAQGVHVHTVDTNDLAAVSNAIAQASPTAVLVETISNPLLKITDIPSVAHLTHAAGASLIVDNTFAVPCLYHPAPDGADYVVYSATKYHGGHGDAMGGLIAASAERSHAVRELQKLVGGTLGPNEAWLILRGLKTLILRARQQCQNALTVARFLTSHPRVHHVYYPGLPTHSQFTLARRLLPGDLYGGIVSFEIKGADREEVFGFMNALQLVTAATSLGDVCSLILYPAHSSHRALSDQERQSIGIRPNLLRLSVGIEEASDIIADLAQALGATSQPQPEKHLDSRP
jgi:cystathionine beta-lyase/cystathionine gamma-synthase